MLNGRGEVIGINTQKLIKKNVAGIAFALSATDLLAVLHRFYPNLSPGQSPESLAAAAPAVSSEDAVSPAGASGSDAANTASSDAKTQPLSSTPSSSVQTSSVPSVQNASQTAHGFGTVTITSDPDGAEIYVDEKYVGNTPAKLKLSTGNHVMIIKVAGFPDWKRTLEVLKDSQVTLRPVFESAP